MTMSKSEHSGCTCCAYHRHLLDVLAEEVAELTVESIVDTDWCSQVSTADFLAVYHNKARKRMVAEREAAQRKPCTCAEPGRWMKATNGDEICGRCHGAWRGRA